MSRGAERHDITDRALTDRRSRPIRAGVRAYRPGDEQQILPLYPLNFGGLQRSAAYWQWKFRENPAGQHVYVAEDAGGRIAGVAAGLLSRVHHQGREVVFSQFCEVMVDPTLRQGLRRGVTYRALLTAVIGEATRTGGALIFGLPNENSDRMVQALFRGRTLHQVSRVVRPTGPASGLSPSDWPARLRYAVRPLREPDRLLDALWERCRPGFPLATIRDREYVTWRYLRCPHVSYRVSVAWDRRRRPAGLAVLRMGWAGEPLCAIVDWLVPRDEPGAAVALLAHAERAARRAGMREVAAWFPPDAPERQWFLARGYRVELTRYPLLTIIPDPGLPTAWVARHWYYTMGDSDIF